MQPIFIIGAPRSGTTFLASLLSVTEYGPPFETHFITKYYKQLHHYGNLNELKNFSFLLKDILNERPVMQWDLQINIKDFFKSFSQPIHYSNVVNQLCLMASKKRGYDSWGDKTPNYLGNLDILYTLFPNSKYIYIIRDGRDVALSLHEKDWGPNNIYFSAQYWNSLNKENKYLDKLALSGNLLTLKYEDLIDETELSIKKIYGFLDIEYNINDTKNLLLTVKKGNYNKWKMKMSSHQIEVFDSIAAETLKKHGYETSVPSIKSIPTLWVALYTIHNYYFRARHLFIINIIDTIKIRFFGKPPFGE